MTSQTDRRSRDYAREYQQRRQRMTPVQKEREKARKRRWWRQRQQADVRRRIIEVI